MLDASTRYIIIKGVRVAWFRNTVRKNVLKAAEYAVPSFKKDGTPKLRLGKQCYKRTYTCARCKEDKFKVSEVQVNHINCVGPSIGSKNAPDWLTWDIYFKRMFTTESNLEVLCKSCHAIDTIKDKQDIVSGVWAKRVKEELGD